MFDIGFFDRLKNEPITISSNVNDTNIYNSSNGIVNITEEDALKIATVYSCVELIASSVASLPLKLYKKTDKGRERIYDDSRAKLFSVEPNSNQTPYNFLHNAVVRILLDGNFYAFIEKKQNEVVALYPISKDDVDFEEKENVRTGEMVIKYKFKGKKYDQFNFLNIVKDSENGYKGISILDRGAGILSIGKHQSDYVRNLFTNGANIRGYLQTDQVLSREAKENLKSTWNLYSGSANAGKTPVLEANLKFVPLQYSAQDTAQIENAKFNVQEICRLFRVPPHLVYELSKSTFNNISEQNIEFLNNSLSGYLKAIEQTCNKTLLQEEEKGLMYFEFDTSAYLRGSHTQFMENLGRAVNLGLMTTNEARAKLNLPSVENGDFLTVQLNSAMLVDGKILNPNILETMTKNENKLGDEDIEENGV